MHTELMMMLTYEYIYGACIHIHKYLFKIIRIRAGSVFEKPEFGRTGYSGQIGLRAIFRGKKSFKKSNSICNIYHNNATQFMPIFIQFKKNQKNCDVFLF